MSDANMEETRSMQARLRVRVRVRDVKRATEELGDPIPGFLFPPPTAHLALR